MAGENVLVLGGNFAGLTAPLTVKHELGAGADVRVVSKSDHFLFNPSLIWIPFGKRKAKDIVFLLAETFESHGVDFVSAEATRIDGANAYSITSLDGAVDSAVCWTKFLNDPGPAVVAAAHGSMPRNDAEVVGLPAATTR